jgi:hypothetical protein
LSVYVFVCVCVCLFVCLCVSAFCLHVCLFVCLLACLCVLVFFVCMSVCLCVCVYECECMYLVFLCVSCKDFILQHTVISIMCWSQPFSSFSVFLSLWVSLKTLVSSVYLEVRGHLFLKMGLRRRSLGFMILIWRKRCWQV